MNKLFYAVIFFLSFVASVIAEPRDEIEVTPEFAEKHGIVFYAEQLKHGCNGALFTGLSGYPHKLRGKELAFVRLRTTHETGKVTEFYLEHAVPEINFCYPQDLLSKSVISFLYTKGTGKNLYLLINDFAPLIEQSHNKAFKRDGLQPPLN